MLPLTMRSGLGGLLLGACLLTAAVAVDSDLICPGNTTAEQVLGDADFSGRIAVVTGGDSGLGYEMAMAFAGRHATVVIATHNETKGAAAATAIKAVHAAADVRSMALDLASLASVRAFATSYEATFGKRLHFLLNNAGITHPSIESHDGFELVYQVDFLGHFLLTELLLPSLRASAPSRVINTASGAHENACEMAGWSADCFKDWTYLPPPVVPKRNVTVHYKTGAVNASSSSYGIAKFANIQHAAALAQREAKAGIKAFSLTPGFAMTGMTGHIDPSDPTIRAFCKQQVKPDPSIPSNPCPFSAAQGAASIAQAVVGNSQSGAYLSRTWACMERPVVMQGFTEVMQEEFYERSLRLVGAEPAAAGITELAAQVII
mmetsp:Transcript_50127/g.119314  ORF Transcript_50127/g.119314 Transcript_50127/m.119314 type:complete len:377 (-) Transcript_50127:42-1172(-)